MIFRCELDQNKTKSKSSRDFTYCCNSNTVRNSPKPKHTEKSNILGRFVVHSLEENFVFLGTSISVILGGLFGVVYIHGVTLTSVTGHF